MISHISFDLWLTLIKSNPQAKIAKYYYLQKYLNHKYKDYYSIEKIENSFKQVDLASTYASEVTGKHIDFETMLLHILSNLNVPVQDFDKQELDRLQGAFDAIFLTHPPVLFDKNTLNVLEDLTEAGYSINILSNTGFIEGRVLEVVLDLLNIKQFFKNRLYSDVFGIAKPNSKFFNKVEELYGIDKKFMLHVGDNLNADYHGAIKAGMNSMIINNPGGLTIIDLYDYLKTANKWKI